MRDNAAIEMELPGYRMLARTRSRDCPVALHQRGRGYAITSCNNVLMTNEDTSSELALGRLTTTFLHGVARPRILVGGLGMGFTLRAILDRLPRSGRVVVAELLPAVARWNRERIGHLSRHSIDDPRVRVQITDVTNLVRQPGAWDAVVLDVDNGPEWIVQRRNLALYGREGLARLLRSLRPGGILAVVVGPPPAIRAAHAGARVALAPLSMRVATRASDRTGPLYSPRDSRNFLTSPAASPRFTAGSAAIWRWP